MRRSQLCRQGQSVDHAPPGESCGHRDGGERVRPAALQTVNPSLQWIGSREQGAQSGVVVGLQLCSAGKVQQAARPGDGRFDAHLRQRDFEVVSGSDDAEASWEAAHANGVARRGLSVVEDRVEFDHVGTNYNERSKSNISPISSPAAPTSADSAATKLSSPSAADTVIFCAR